MGKFEQTPTPTPDPSDLLITPEPSEPSPEPSSETPEPFSETTPEPSPDSSQDFSTRTGIFEKIHQDERMDSARTRLIITLKDERISKYIPDLRDAPDTSLEVIFQDRTLEEISDYARDCLTKADSTNLMEVELDYGPGFLAFLFLNSDDAQMPLFAQDLEETRSDYSPGTEFDVDFHGNNLARSEIGAGDIFPENIRFIIVRSADGNEWLGERGIGNDHNENERFGYFNVMSGRYIPILTGDTVRIPTQEDFELFGFKDSDQMEGSTQEAYRDDQAVQKTTKEEYDVKVSYIQHVKIAEQEYAQELANDTQDFTSYFNGYFRTDMEIDGEVENGLNDDEIRKLALPLLNNPFDIEFFLKAFDTLQEVESTYRYNALGSRVGTGKSRGKRAIGAYQIMPVNWVSWGKDAIQAGHINPEDIVKSRKGKDIVVPSAKNQDIIALMQFAKVMNHYSQNRTGSEAKDKEIAALMADHWFTGKWRKTIHDIPTWNSKVLNEETGEIEDFIAPENHAGKFVRYMFRDVESARENQAGRYSRIKRTSSNPRD